MVTVHIIISHRTAFVCKGNQENTYWLKIRRFASICPKAGVLWYTQEDMQIYARNLAGVKYSEALGVHIVKKEADENETTKH